MAVIIIIIVIIIILVQESFSHQRQLMVFHWSLSDSKSSQVFRTFLSILVDLNNAVIWMASTRPLIFKPSSPCINPLVTVPKSTNYKWYHSHFYVPTFFFNSPARSRYLSFFSLFFNFTRWSAGTAKFSFFFVEYYKVWSSVRDWVIRLYF